MVHGPQGQVNQMQSSLPGWQLRRPFRSSKRPLVPCRRRLCMEGGQHLWRPFRWRSSRPRRLRTRALWHPRGSRESRTRARAASYASRLPLRCESCFSNLMDSQPDTITLCIDLQHLPCDIAARDLDDV